MVWRGLMLVLLILSLPVFAQPRYWQLDLTGPIGSGTSDFIVSEIEQAQSAQPAFILLTLNTPGGLYSATRDIISAMLASAIPVVVYVAPSGARAASAGTYIIYASHVAAMAPGTHLGAATPVQLGSQLQLNATPALPQGAYAQGHTQAAATDNDHSPADTDKVNKAAPTSENSTAMERKTLNDAIAYIRTLAQLRGRNADWAELAVRDATTLTATEAVAENVIELLSANQSALLLALEGRVIHINDSRYVFSNRQLSPELRHPNWRQRFIIIISNPNITYLLMLVGIYGLLLEFYNPGFGVAGVTGAICLLLALMALQMLPFSIIGLALLGLGLALMMGEAMVPSFGILGGGGVLAFALGSLLLFDTPDQAFRIAWPIIMAFSLVSLGLIVVVIRMIIKQGRALPVSGHQAMIGLQGVALTDIAPNMFNAGYVMVQGERWQARSQHHIAAQQAITVLALHKLTLTVEPTRLSTRPSSTSQPEESHS